MIFFYSQNKKKRAKKEIPTKIQTAPSFSTYFYYMSLSFLFNNKKNLLKTKLQYRYSKVTVSPPPFKTELSKTVSISNFLKSKFESNQIKIFQ
jgi:hypothetical protein